MTNTLINTFVRLYAGACLMPQAGAGRIVVMPDEGIS